KTLCFFNYALILRQDYDITSSLRRGALHEAPDDVVSTGSTTKGTSKKKGRTVALTTEDMQKRKNDVKARTTLLLALPDEHQLRFRKKISIQGTDVAGFDKSKVECFNCHKMGHFARECRALRSQDKGRRDNYRQGSKVEEQAPKVLMAIDGVGWIEASWQMKKRIMLYKITELTDKLSDTKTTLYHYKLGLSQVESRLVEFKNQEVKYCEKIRGLEFKVEAKANRIECLINELELLKKEKEGLESKLTGFQSASKDLDSLLESQRSDKNKEGLGYSDVPPSSAQVYSPPKKDLSWTGLLEFADDTVIDYSRPSPAIESTSDNVQNRNPFVTETEASPSTISSKPFIKFVKAADSPNKNKADKVKTAKKPTVKYAEQYRKPSKKSNVDQGRSWEKNNNTHKSRTPITVFHKTARPPMRTNRPTMNVAQPKRTSFYKPTPSYNKRPFQRTSAVRSQFRPPRVPTVTRKFPTVNRKFPTVNRKFPTGNTKFSTADMGNKGKAVKASACWIWKPILNLSNKCPNSNCVSAMFKKYTYIDTQSRLKSVMAWVPKRTNSLFTCAGQLPD
nr:hypothetical protein [Tanacetum cinerariifolium]